jgi:hypothetical protein
MVKASLTFVGTPIGEMALWLSSIARIERMLAKYNPDSVAETLGNTLLVFLVLSTVFLVYDRITSERHQKSSHPGGRPVQPPLDSPDDDDSETKIPFI